MTKPKLQLQKETIETLQFMKAEHFRDLYVKNPELWRQVEAQVSALTEEDLRDDDADPATVVVLDGATTSSTTVTSSSTLTSDTAATVMSSTTNTQGFGFFDNSIMLLCGDFFDSYLGTFLGISTLAAAALGNVVGDVSGIWLGGTVEFIVGKNVEDHMMTTKQMKSTRVQTLKTIAMTSGIFFGCILGMFPLVWPAEWRLWGGSNSVLLPTKSGSSESNTSTVNTVNNTSSSSES